MPLPTTARSGRSHAARAIEIPAVSHINEESCVVGQSQGEDIGRLHARRDEPRKRLESKSEAESLDHGKPDNFPERKACRIHSILFTLC